jgi:PST family polysaccharide transporter
MKLSTFSAASLRRLGASLAGDRLLSNLGWYGLSEMASRTSRLLAAIVLARTMDAAEFGVAAIAITCFELIRVLTNNGIGQLVVRASAERLNATCNTAYRATWLVCLATAALQVSVGVGVAYWCGRSDLFAMIACLAIVYIVMIPGLMPAYLLMRENGIREIAAVSGVQSIVDNLLTALLALVGFGAWSIVLPKLLTAPIWLLGVRHYKHWKRDHNAGTIPLATVVRFAAPILGSEILVAARLNLDKIAVFCMLGVDALGVYYFAFNAGIGFSLALTTALSNSVYPELAKLAQQPVLMLRRFDKALRNAALPISIAIGAQALLAFIYVPIVFGAKWTSVTPLVALLCLSAVTKPFFDSAVQLLRAGGKTGSELVASLLLSTALLGTLTIGLIYGLTAGIAAFSAACLLLQALFTFFARAMIARQVRNCARGELVPLSVQI